MASGLRGRGGRGRPRGGRPTIGGQQVSWDFNDKSIDADDAQETFFPDIELPETNPPTAAELRMVGNYQLLRKRYHNDLRQMGWPIDPANAELRSDNSSKPKKDPFNAFPSYSTSKYQKKTQSASSVVRIRWDPKRFCLQHFPASLRTVINPTKANAASQEGEDNQSGRPNKRQRVVEDDDDEDDEAKKDDDEGQEGNDLEDEDVEEPDPDETFSQDDEDMAGDYGDNYFENGEDDDDYGGGGDEGGGGDDYE